MQAHTLTCTDAQTYTSSSYEQTQLGHIHIGDKIATIKLQKQNSTRMTQLPFI